MIPASIKEIIEEVVLNCENSRLAEMFAKCFPNTLETTTEILDDGTTYVFTGDIPAMWLRDSTAQVKHYLPLAKEDIEIRRIIEGLIKRQIMYINIDPYANAFNKEPNGSGHQEDLTEQNPWIWERKYEIDSLCNPIQLSYLYWKQTGETSIFDEEYKKAVKTIIALWITEQNHTEKSMYSFQRFGCVESDTLKNNGKGTPVKVTGMTWSGFRPSDDACIYGYLVPANMFAAVVLGYIEEISEAVYGDLELKASAARLKSEIDSAIKQYGIYEHEKYGKIYAYETDGYGNYNLMDDANCPSLLCIPYMGYTTKEDPIYINTRQFLLSEDNPYYREGKAAKGIGSPHTPAGFIWPIALCMQALTSNSKEEVDKIIEMLLNTTADTGFMHESFDPDNPAAFTREWFAWANSLFGELIYKRVIEKSL